MYDTLSIPDRPQETVTWETRVEPQIMATMLEWLESIGIMPRTKSELLRLSCISALDILVMNDQVTRIDDLEEALERLAKSGIINLNSPKSMSKTPSMAIHQALARAKGEGFNIARKFIKAETAPPIFRPRLSQEEFDRQVAIGLARAEAEERLQAAVQEPFVDDRTEEEKVAAKERVRLAKERNLLIQRIANERVAKEEAERRRLNRQQAEPAPVLPEEEPLEQEFDPEVEALNNPEAIKAAILAMKKKE